ncbi:MAG: DUF1223 domain-containing protein [Polyangiaceae bacterium]
MGPRLVMVALLGLVACRSATASPPEARPDGQQTDGRQTEGPPGIAVVELFTSEGCSSCPPADRVLAEIAEGSDPGTFALSFHVDYWDDLGWPDPFASPDYGDRQQTYSRALGVRGMYTPQMVVNGGEEFIGSDRDRAREALARALATPAKVRLTMHPRWTASNEATVDYEASRTPRAASLYVAVVQRHATTSVLRGENAGKTLHHENVVCSLAVVPLASARGSVAVQVPSSVAPVGAELIGWVQAAPTLVRGIPVLGAARSPLPDR